LHAWIGFVIPRSLRVPRFKAFRSLALPALAATALLVLAYELAGFTAVHSTLADFRAFWCAGSAVLHGADPYRTASLAACEHAPAPWGLYSAPNGLVVPAPLPPYALALLAPLALLTYPAAACVWFVALAAATAASLRLLMRTLCIPASAAAWMLLLPVTVLWLPFGETAPLALFGAVLAARAMQLQRWGAAAAGLALLAIEPHVALGAWICVAAFMPRMRLALVFAALVLGGLSFAIGIGVPAEYLLRVLPLHALAELPRPVQFSAAWLLDAAGAPPAASLRAGSVSYVVMLAAGITAAARLRGRWNDASVLVYAPMAAALVGGAFIHASQLALALPFAAMLASRERGRISAAAAVACGTLAVPWLQGGQQSIVLAGVAAATCVVWLLSRSERLTVRAMSAWLVLAVLLVVAHRAPHTAGQHMRVFPIAPSAAELASAPWGREIWREQSQTTLADWLGKAPSWIALLLLVGGAAGAAVHKEPVVAIRIDEAPALP
jgi:hypothetical protein